MPHLKEDELPPQGGKPGWAGPPSPRIGPWLRLLKRIAETHNLIPEFEVGSFKFSIHLFLYLITSNYFLALTIVI